MLPFVQHVELHYFKEQFHAETNQPIYLVQFAIDGKCCTPFWDTAEHRAQLGEDAWFNGLQENAEGLLRELGPAPALGR